jgi:hypothetical protein
MRQYILYIAQMVMGLILMSACMPGLTPPLATTELATPTSPVGNSYQPIGQNIFVDNTRNSPFVPVDAGLIRKILPGNYPVYFQMYPADGSDTSRSGHRFEVNDIGVSFFIDWQTRYYSNQDEFNADLVYALIKARLDWSDGELKTPTSEEIANAIAGVITPIAVSASPTSVLPAVPTATAISAAAAVEVVATPTLVRIIPAATPVPALGAAWPTPAPPALVPISIPTIEINPIPAASMLNQSAPGQGNSLNTVFDASNDYGIEITGQARAGNQVCELHPELIRAYIDSIIDVIQSLKVMPGLTDERVNHAKEVMRIATLKIHIIPYSETDNPKYYRPGDIPFLAEAGTELDTDGQYGLKPSYAKMDMILFDNATDTDPLNTCKHYNHVLGHELGHPAFQALTGHGQGGGEGGYNDPINVLARYSYDNLNMVTTK